MRAIIGPNGAGKTTFFNLITGFLSRQKARSCSRRNDVTQIPAHLRVGLGMARTFQVTEIFPELTVHENVLIGAEVAGEHAMWLRGRRVGPLRSCQGRRGEMLALTGLTAKADRLVGELAHGDQRTPEIAMALACKPRLLLLDEPTAGMGDQETYEIAA